jgi:iron complex transport system permease protein
VRLIPSTVEVKIGVVTALIGVPVFLWVVARRPAGFADAA